MANEKVLLLTDHFIPFNNANGICMYRYAKAFLKKGYEVHVLCFQHKGEALEETLEGLCLHRIRPRIFYRMTDYSSRHAGTRKSRFVYKAAIAMHRIKALFFLRRFPMESPAVCRRYLHKTVKISRDNEIKNIVAMYMPLEAAYTAARIKRILTDSKVFYVGGDTFTNTQNARTYAFIDKVGYRWEKSIFKGVDGIAHLAANAASYEAERFDAYRDKFHIIDIPFPEQRQRKKVVANLCPGSMNIMYMGGLSEHNETFVKSLNIFEKWNSLQAFDIHFFSRGDADGLLRKKQLTWEWLHAHGQVPYAKLLACQDEADIFVTFGPSNKMEVNIPSKIFECIASGKIWIHFYSYPHDVSLPYAEKYPNGLGISVQDGIDANADKLMDFVGARLRRDIPQPEIEAIFKASSATATAECMIEVFQNAEGT